MPRLDPFTAIRYSPADPVERVSAPPYDVISPESRDVLAADPHNVVHLTLPQDEGPRDRYSVAATTLAGWLEQGVLVPDAEPSFFVYGTDETEGVSHSSRGVIGALTLEEFGTGVHPHERTLAGPKADRLALMQATDANLEPLWFFGSGPLRGFEEAVVAATSADPLSDLTTEGVRHRLWRLLPEDAQLLLTDLRTTDLIVADGHHRYETALTFRGLRRATRGPGPWDQTLALISDTFYMPPQLRPIHRVCRGDVTGVLAELAIEELGLELSALLEEVGRRGTGSIGVISSRVSGIFRSGGDLDTEYLGGIVEKHSAPVRYEHAFEQLSVEIGDGATVFIMAPVELPTVAVRAISGERMPPKTTLFMPKPRSGLVMRSLVGSS